MESILSMHDEVYPLKSRRHRSFAHLSNPTNIKKNTLNTKTNILLLFYQYIKKAIAQRSLYVLGVLNLILAGIAIICVTQAEDHPEYFSLVYIAVSIFIFYMATIILIIILQIIETYQEQYQRNRSSLSVKVPLLTPQINVQSNPIIVESMTTKTQAKTRLLRSRTLPLTSSSINFHHTLSTSTSTSSSTLKDFNQITSLTTTHLALLPKYQQSIVNIPKNYQSFALTTNDQLSPLYKTITNSSTNPHLPSLIKPIPFKYHINNGNNKQKIKFLDD